MTWIELLHTFLLVILIDRQLILRDRYMFAIENRIRQQYSPYFSVWIYCKQKGEETYWRTGGKRLFIIRFKDKVK